MNERLAKKLKKILAKAGLEEEEIGKIVEEVESAVAEEEVPDDSNPEEVEAQEGENTVEEEIPADAPADELPSEAPAEEALPPQEEVAPTTDGSIEQALQELAAEEGAAAPETDVPPAPSPEAPAPAFDPSMIQGLQADLMEANKTIEGLVARISSLEEALKGAGVISNDSKVGDENPRITPNANAYQEDAFDDMLTVINGK